MSNICSVYLMLGLESKKESKFYTTTEEIDSAIKIQRLKCITLQFL